MDRSFGSFVAPEPEEMDSTNHGGDVEITQEFREVLDCVQELLERDESGFVLVTGMAGTGKSTLLSTMRRQLSGMNLMVVAPTGIAALNVGGETIHRAFHLSTTLCPEPKKVKKASWLAVKHMKVLIIDEISMVRADVMDSISKVISKEKGINLPFGGILVVAFGDLFQLPPVLTRRDKEEFYKLYTNRFFFGAQCLREIKPRIYELTEPFRQKDTLFIDLLRKIREGGELDQVVESINRACMGSGSDNSMILTTTNSIAAQTNESKLKRLTGKSKSYEATWQGKYFDEKGDESLPAPKTLTLKIGAKVMLTKNSKDWVNGTLGEVAYLEQNAVGIETDDGKIHEVQKVSWDIYKHKFEESSKKISAEVVASYTQFPLRLAWACTIHKSQGLTLKDCTIDLGHGTFEVGQAYVALSRCCSMENLSLRKKLTIHDIKVSPDAVQFHQYFLKQS